MPGQCDDSSSETRELRVSLKVEEPLIGQELPDACCVRLLYV